MEASPRTGRISATTTSHTIKPPRCTASRRATPELSACRGSFTNTSTNTELSTAIGIADQAQILVCVRADRQSPAPAPFGASVFGQSRFSALRLTGKVRLQPSCKCTYLIRREFANRGLDFSNTSHRTNFTIPAENASRMQVRIHSTVKQTQCNHECMTTLRPKLTMAGGITMNLEYACLCLAP